MKGIGTRDEIINRIVDRFLGWRLPDDFAPDAGIAFVPEYNAEYMSALGKPPMRHEPTGTNLFTADQATKMLGEIAGDEIDFLLQLIQDTAESEHACNKLLVREGSLHLGALQKIAALEGKCRTRLSDWEIDKSTDVPILTYKKCSVIQDEQAFLIMKALSNLDAAILAERKRCAGVCRAYQRPSEDSIVSFTAAEIEQKIKEGI